METNKHVKINYGPQIVNFVSPVVADIVVVGCSAMLQCFIVYVVAKNGGLHDEHISGE